MMRPPPIYICFFRPIRGEKPPCFFDPEISEAVRPRRQAPPLSSRRFHHHAAKNKSQRKKQYKTKFANIKAPDRKKMHFFQKFSPPGRGRSRRQPLFFRNFAFPALRNGGSCAILSPQRPEFPARTPGKRAAGCGMFRDGRRYMEAAGTHHGRKKRRQDP